MAIKNICDQQMSELLLIVKLVTPYAYFSAECLKQIKLNIFALNFRHMLISHMLSLLKQHVIFRIEVDKTKFFIAVVYASNSHVI